MGTLTDNTNLTTAADDLIQQAARARADHARTVPQRYARDIPAVDPLDWLAAAQAPDSFYWRSRDNQLELAGIGLADVEDLTANDAFASIDALSEKLNHADSDCRYFGGLRFDPLLPPDKPVTDWTPFGLGRFVLPRWSLTRSHDRTTLALNCRADETDFINPFATTTPSSDMPEVSLVDRKDTPDFEGWQKTINSALTEIGEDRCDKVVLARRSELTLSNTISPWLVLRHLRERSHDVTLFALRVNGGPCFLGATPERLYYRHENALLSEAMAGTRPRGNTEAVDNALARELLASEKDIREHAFVVNSLRSHLATVCSDIQVDAEPEIFRLARVQHLRTRVAGRLRRSIIDGRLLSLVHPTPAVNGYPRSAALNLIRELEPFDRGWYAGPIGWIGPKNAEFAVAIRSAILDRDALTLYAGAGIVEGSTADREWAELEHKIALYADIFENTP